jgi:hypothetical protein
MLFYNRLRFRQSKTGLLGGCWLISNPNAKEINPKIIAASALFLRNRYRERYQTTISQTHMHVSPQKKPV